MTDPIEPRHVLIVNLLTADQNIFLDDLYGIIGLGPPEPIPKHEWEAWAKQHGITPYYVQTENECVSGCRLKLTDRQAVHLMMVFKR